MPEDKEKTTKSEPTIDLSSRVLERIQKQKINMRSKWIFIAEKLGLESGLLLSVLIAIFMIGLAFYILDENGIFEFSEFGFKSFRVFLDNIPFDIAAFAIVFLLVSEIIIRKFDFSYKKYFKYLPYLVFTFVIVGGVVMYKIDYGRELFEREKAGSLSILYSNKITKNPRGERAIIGKITQISERMYVIQTPQGQIYQVNYFLPSESPSHEIFFEGQIVKIIGRRNGEIFQAEDMRTVRNNYLRFAPLPILPEKLSSQRNIINAFL